MVRIHTFLWTYYLILQQACEVSIIPYFRDAEAETQNSVTCQRWHYQGRAKLDLNPGL